MVIQMTVAISDVTNTVVTQGGGSEGVSAVTLNLRHDAAAKCEGGEGVVVCEEDHGMD